jgi:hypothetical protein
MIIEQIQNKINSITSRLERYDNINGAFGDVLINDVIESVKWLADLQSSGKVEAYLLANIERSDNNKLWQNLFNGVATDLSHFLEVYNNNSIKLSRNKEYRTQRAEKERNRLCKQFIEVVDDDEAAQRNFIINSAGEWWESLENEVETLLTILEKYTGKQSDVIPKASGFSKRLVNNNDTETIPKLHKLLAGKKGKDAALIICAAIKKGVITRPTFSEVRNEFGNIGNKSGYNKYMQSFNDEELEPIMNAFDSLY